MTDVSNFLVSIAQGCKRPLTNGEVADLLKYNDVEYPTVPPVGDPYSFILFNHLTGRS